MIRFYVWAVRSLGLFAGWRSSRWLRKAKALARHASRIEGDPP